MCAVLTYRITVEGPEGPGWFLKAEATPEREAMKVDREVTESSTVFVVMFGIGQRSAVSGRYECTWAPKSFLLSAQKDGKTFEYRVRVPEDVEPVPGGHSKLAFRSKRVIVMVRPAGEVR